MFSASLLRSFSRSDELDRCFGYFSIAGLFPARGCSAPFVPSVEQSDDDDSSDDS
jgi:hypothetical protein